jgi:hypothetical protein
MLHPIKNAAARPDFTVEIIWREGGRDTVSLAWFIARSGVAEPLKDPRYFVERMTIGGDGDWLAWPNDVDLSADGLWYQAHPDELARDNAVDAAE